MNFKVKFKEETPSFKAKFGWNNGEFEAGKAEGAREEYDRFWKIIQTDGRSVYMYMFCWWDWEYGDPETPIVINSVNIHITGMFSCCPKLKTINAKKFDFVNVGNAGNLFASCLSLESVPKINLHSTNLNGAYMDCHKLKTVGLFDVSRISPNWAFNSTFKNCYALEDIGEVRGQISQNGLNLQWSTKLDKATFIRIVDALSDAETGKSVTFSQVAKEAAFTAEEWAALIGTKPNWTIALA